jgi:hypothetical protein
MSEVTLGELIGIADKIGVLAFAFIIAITGARKKWVFYWFHEERVNDLKEAYERTIADLAKQLTDSKTDGKEWKVMALDYHSAVQRAKKVVDEKSSE